ncbi:MAG: CDP-alcohol phosphatidyltransferase family protein [Planctomycetota bacterium]|nr:CDP-alcohol phosphatidyltransferase family protein [Planctomycetota bacterium]
MGWANRITIGRGICTIVVWVLIVVGTFHPSDGLWWTAFLLFALAAVTDFVDGMVARRLGEVSQLGRNLDPLVDKLLTIGAMTLLLGVPGAQAVLPAWMVALFLMRELVVTTLRGSVESHGGNFQAVTIGKYKMTLQCLAAGGVMALPLHWPWAHDPIPFLDWLPVVVAPWSLTHLIVWIALVITVYSGFVYVARAIRMLRTPPRNRGDA